jgi:predicted MFS family arabinose efflux permease
VALALALNAAMIYAGIAIGSAMAAVILARFGLEGLGVAAGVMAVLALIHLIVSAWMTRAISGAA